MKKLFTYFTAVLFVLCMFAAPTMACEGSYCGPGYAFGTLDIDTFDIGGGLMTDFKSIPNGFAGGIGAGGGIASGSADGSVFNGFVSGELTSIAGGFGSSETYRLSKYDVFECGSAPDKFIGVGSSSSAYAITGASFKIKIDPNKCGFGAVDAHIGGIAGQGTLDVSGVGPSPLDSWNTDGHTGGIAGQGSVGGFAGSGFALSGPDYTERASGGTTFWVKIHGKNAGEVYEKPFDWHPQPNEGNEWVQLGRYNLVDSKAGAGAGAEIEMNGYSISESYRWMDNDGAYHTEGMGTRVAAGTEVTSSGYDYDWDEGLSDSGAFISGGFVAAGGASACTVQTLPGAGMASAHASGLYVGSGPLGASFSGSVNGYTGTSMTTMSGMNGVISSSTAGMSVNTSYTNGGGMPN